MWRLACLFLATFLTVSPGISWASSSDFNGTSSQIVVSHGSAISTTTLSTGCWMRREGTGSYNPIVTKTNNSDAGWEFFGHHATDTLRFVAYWSNQANWEVSRPALETWTHVAVTYDGSSTSGEAVIYVNGAEASTSNTVEPSGSWAQGTENLSLGAYPAVEIYLDGQLAECFYYDRVLSANEIKMIAGRCSTCGVQALSRNRIGHWPMGVFEGRNYTGTTGLDGSATGLSVLYNGPPVSYRSQGRAR